MVSHVVQRAEAAEAAEVTRCSSAATGARAHGAPGLATLTAYGQLRARRRLVQLPVLPSTGALHAELAAAYAAARAPVHIGHSAARAPSGTARFSTCIIILELPPPPRPPPPSIELGT